MRVGWDVKTVEQVCSRVFAGGDVPKNNLSKVKTDKFFIPIYANGEKNKGLYGFTNIEKVTEPSITVSARGTIGYSEIRNTPFYPIVRLIVLTPNKDIVSLDYMKYAIGNIEFKKSGTSIPQLTVPMIKKYEFPTPSLHEQKQIVAILDKAFTAIDQAKVNIEKNIENAKELFQSKLNEIFSQTGDGWEEKTLGEITTKIGSGSTPRGGQASYKESGISLIRSMNVHDDGFNDKKLAFIDDEQADKLKNVIIKENDVLLNITGASVARCCIAPKEYLPARVNQHVSIIRLEENIMESHFLHYALTSQKNKQLLLGIGEQGSTRQAITKVQLQNFKLSYPKSLTEQSNLLKSIDGFRDKSNKFLNHCTKKLKNLEELKKSILQKAFAGELTH